MRSKLTAIFLSSITLVLTVTPVLAQAEARVQIHAIDDSRFPTLSIVTSVVDGSGHPITGLTAADFEVLEDGTPAALLDVQPVVNTDLGIAVVIAIDMSTSMLGAPLTATQQAAAAFIDSLGPADQVAVLAFADTVQVLQDFTSDRQAAHAAVQGLRPGGRTALYDGAFHAVELASQAGLPRRMVVLLSDGNEFGGLSLARRGDAFLAANQQGVPVYTIALGSSVDVPYMDELAALTGGEMYVAPSSSQVATRYGELAELLRNQYVLSVQSRVLGDSQEHALTVRLTDSGAQASRTFSSRAVAPAFAIRGLEAEQVLAERTTVSLDVTSQGPIKDVTYALDGQPVSGESQPPYSLVVNPNGLTPGFHTLSIEVRDTTGSAARDDILFEVPSLAPSVSLPILSGVETVSNAVVLEPVVASQNPVRQVTYSMDGSPVHATDQPPYRYTLDPADLQRGAHTLTVTVEDENGQQASAEFGFTSSGAPVSLLTVGLGVGVLAIFALSALLLVTVLLSLRRRPARRKARRAAATQGEDYADAWLEVEVGGKQTGDSFALGRDRIVIGRSPRCDFVLNDTERYVSREHAVVWLQDARYMLEDLNSTRGTMVNGRRLGEQHRLANGDEIRLGSYILRFYQLVYDEDMEMTRQQPTEQFTSAETDLPMKTDPLGEKERRAQRGP